MNSVEVHPQARQNGHPVDGWMDGWLVCAVSAWVYLIIQIVESSNRVFLDQRLLTFTAARATTVHSYWAALKWNWQKPKWNQQ
jgi:hypothetical protein